MTGVMVAENSALSLKEYILNIGNRKELLSIIIVHNSFIHSFTIEQTFNMLFHVYIGAIQLTHI